ncbi:MAG: cation:proton antiporter [Nitrososphaerales archaeon]
MVLDIPLLLGLAGVFILIGYVSDYIFRRHGFPDIIIMLAIGILIGPVFGVVDRADIIDLAPMLSALVITIILFNGGLNMNYERIIRGSGRAIILAGISFVLTMITTALITHLMLGWEPQMGLLLGAIIGGTSAAIVIPLANKISSSQKTSTLLSLESAYTDVIVVMVAITIIQIITIQANPDVLGFATRGIVNGFLIGASIGIVVGLAWMRAMTAMKTAYEDILTLAIAFALYGITEYLGGSGPVVALAFGITFGNAPRLFQSLTHELPHVRDTDVEVSARKFHSQIAFMVRALFFLFLGLIITISNTGMIIAGIVVALMLFFPRIGASWISTYKDQELKKDVWMISFMLPRGLAAGVAALLPLLYNIENSAIFTDITFVVIVATVAITTIGINSTKLSRRIMPTLRTTTGSIARTSTFQKSMMFTAIGFAITVSTVLAYNNVTGGEVFEKFTPTFGKGLVSDLSIKPVGEDKTYFFNSGATEQNADRLYGPSKALSYKWEFGDGMSSDAKQVVHQYSEAGVYVAKLTIVREDGVIYSENMVLLVPE